MLTYADVCRRVLTPVLTASKTETRCDGVHITSYLLVKLLPVDMKFYVRVKLGKLPVEQRTARRYDGAPDTESAHVSIRQHTSAYVAAEAL
jgi:hypothetical protein